MDPNSVDEFFNLVNDYNTIVGSTGLSGDFTSFTHTEYDVEKISHLWNQKKGDFVGTNCRINSYCLLKNSVTIPKLEKNDQLLFLDNDAIDKGKVFDSQDKEEFDILFSRVPTEATTDVKVHAEKMETFFSQFQFNEKARMLSVVLHDNLDGEYLFVGHVGVLVPADDGFLFVEKLTFEEPYQAIKFASKEDCYKYLGTKYADYTGEGLAKPFIMDNDKWVKL
ncbi:lipoprotein%2C putative [Streptococcus pneumoniae]|nr:lipoprotein%2C putative [Streptococcus pneumoniae]